MKNTKELVLETARQLFNEKGYSGVSMRMIATKAGISVGNLTYYFARKEDIVRALLEDGDDTPVMKKAGSFKDLADHLLTMITGVKKNSFFFNDPNLQALNPTWFQKNYTDVQNQQKYLKEKLIDLKQAGYFTSTFNESDMDDYIHIIMLAHLSWAKETRYDSVFTDLNMQQFIALQMRLLNPYCTEKGKKELKQYEI